MFRQRTCAANGETIPFANCFTQLFTPISMIRAATTELESCNLFMCSEWSSWSTTSTCVPSCGPRGTISERAVERRCVVNGSETINVRERQELEDCSVNRLSQSCSVQPCEATEPPTTPSQTTSPTITSTSPLVQTMTTSSETVTAEPSGPRNMITWSSWSSCSESCGNGVEARVPFCIFP